VIAMNMKRPALRSSLAFTALLACGLPFLGPSGAHSEGPEPKITLSLKGVSIEQALVELFKQAGKEYRLEARDVQGTVTANLSGVSLRVALRALLNAARPVLTYRVEDGRYVILIPPPNPEQLRQAEDAVFQVAPSFTSRFFPRGETLQQCIQGVLPREREERYRRIPWRIGIMAARKEAQQQRKPIFLFFIDGHPLTCV
jgi:hypothetical protein